MSEQQQENPYAAWVGRKESQTACIESAATSAMAATLDYKTVPQAGDPLPHGWQWLYFNPRARRSDLGEDGHPARGGFLPPVELPRRMWAGSRIKYIADIPIGAAAEKSSEILSVKNKLGKSGALCFVTVKHSISCDGDTCIEEEQDIVYRDVAPASSGAPAAPKRHEAEAEWSVEFQPDTPLLFRYSALTFNGHRIHYDKPYACEEEGYPNLVVQGPLTATLLQKFAVDCAEGAALTDFSFRGVSPLFVDRSFRLEASREDDKSLSVWARGPDGELSMSATAVFG